ncbi:MAG: beta-ketoacyl-ACP synthase II [Candidatus Dormibacteria bacterium]
MSADEIVVTGMGCVSPLGEDVASTWIGMLERQSGIGWIHAFDPPEDLRTKIAGEVSGFDGDARFGRKTAHRMARYAQFAMAATEEALAQSEIDFAHTVSERVGVVVASGIGGLRDLEQAHEVMVAGGPRRVSPLVIPMLIADMASAHIAIRYKLRGPNFGVVSACSSGAHAIGESAEMIRRGDADVMVAGGAEAAVTELAIASFNAARALSERNDPPAAASRPFDLGRDGFVIGEGAAVLVLESREHARHRGAQVLATLAGYAAGSDAFHITAPEPDGRGIRHVMSRALEKAGVATEEVDYINAHGTSTELNDRAESAAIRATFAGHERAYGPPVSSTKSMTGHLLGAAGALESIVCIKAIQTGRIPPTINLDAPDPACLLDHVTVARVAKVRHALNNSFGFGGHNACLVFSETVPA